MDNPRIDELRRRVQSDPASISYAALAEEYRRAGRFDEAIAVCATGLKRHPSYLSAHVTLGRALIEIGQYDEAQEELEFVLRAAPENLAAIRGLAEIHHRRGDAVYGVEEDPLENTPLAPQPLAPAVVPMPPPAVSVTSPDVPAPPASAPIPSAAATTTQAAAPTSIADAPVRAIADAQVRALEAFLTAVRQAR